MKTIGERIRQARTAKRMSGEELAAAVGYKHQSAIGNLENRTYGTGGNKLSEIARVLSVSVDWLMNGPDSDQVPFLPPMESGAAPAVITTMVQQSQRADSYVGQRAYWPFRTPIEDFKRGLTLDDLEQLNQIIEQFVAGHHSPAPAKKNGSAH